MPSAAAAPNCRRRNVAAGSPLSIRITDGQHRAFDRRFSFGLKIRRLVAILSKSGVGVSAQMVQRLQNFFVQCLEAQMNTAKPGCGSCRIRRHVNKRDLTVMSVGDRFERSSKGRFIALGSKNEFKKPVQEPP